MKIATGYSSEHIIPKSTTMTMGILLGVPCVNTKKGFSLAKAMKDKGPVWDAIVGENKLHPTKIEEDGNWWFADLILNRPLTSVLSMNKSKECDFLVFSKHKNFSGIEVNCQDNELCFSLLCQAT
jgi:hypothetical protein